MNENQKPENMNDIYSREKLEFMCQYKVRSAVMRVLKEHFEVQEMIVITEKKDESKQPKDSKEV